MSGFPGQHGYSEFASQLTRRDREALRLEVPPVDRSADAGDIVDAAFLRARLTDDRLAAEMLNRLGEYCRTLEDTVGKLERIARLNP